MTQQKYDNLRVVNLATNQGKAMGLRTAALLAKSEILVCIDGDALDVIVFDCVTVIDDVSVIVVII